MPFDRQPTLSDGLYTVRPLAEGDRDALAAVAADPAIWSSGYTHGRMVERAFFDGWFDRALATRSAFAFAEEASGDLIGSSRYYDVPTVPDDISIGFTFLARRLWGGAANGRLKALMLDHAFAEHETVWLHIAPTNIRSRKAAGKIGARYTHDEEIDLTGEPVLWSCYRLDRADWQARRG
jgi:RimJ/RimL family protein N-acetyltransferase